MRNNTVIPMLLAGVVFLASAPVHAEYVAYLPGLVLGKGYDTVTGMIKEDCVSMTTDQVPGPGATVAQTYTLTEISSNADLLSITNVDASASADVGLFSASAEMSLLSQNQISNYNANLLAQVSVERGWQFGRNVALKATSQGLVEHNPDGFLRQCGNRYVAGVLYGGEFYGLVMVETTSQKDRKQVSTSFSASYGPFSGDGTFSQDTLTNLNTHEITVKGYMSGAGGGALPLTLDSMRARMAGFPGEIIETGGTPIQVMLLEYPVGTYGATPPALYQLATLRWEYVSAKREVDYVLEQPGQFYLTLNTWRTFLQRLQSDAQRAVQAVDLAISTCKQDVAGCRVPAGIRTPDQLRADLPPRYVAQCGEVSLDFSRFVTEVYPLGVHCGGDKEMDGNNPRISINSEIERAEAGHQIDVEIKVEMVENESNKRKRTCFRDTRSQTFMNLTETYPGCYLSEPSKVTPRTGSLTANGGRDNYKWKDYRTGVGLVKNAECRSDTDGRDDGKLGCREIEFRNAIATLSHEEELMGPNDLKSSAGASWNNRPTISARVRNIKQAQLARDKSAVEGYLRETGSQVPQRPTGVAPLKKVKPTFNPQAVGRPPAHR